MNLKEYLKDKFFYLVFTIFTIVLVFLILILFSVNKYIVILIIVLLFFTNTFYLFGDFIKRKRFYDTINKVLEKLDKKYLIHELIDTPSFLEAFKLKDYLYEIDKSYNDDLNNYKLLLEEFKDYLELWCHEIKTPIATSNLIINNNKNKVLESIEEELQKIEYFTEQIMYYARSENVENDYIINDISLNSVINDVIKSNKKQILSKNIKINKLKEDVRVESDSKWLMFIINQIVINSLNYLDKNGEITFSQIRNKNSIEFIIKDNGIGIKEEDLRRVFDKGFTGENGRMNKKSTGIGLYLVKKLCIKLEHNIKIESEYHKYTKVILIFPLNNHQKSLT